MSLDVRSPFDHAAVGEIVAAHAARVVAAERRALDALCAEALALTDFGRWCRLQVVHVDRVWWDRPPVPPTVACRWGEADE